MRGLNSNFLFPDRRIIKDFCLLNSWNPSKSLGQNFLINRKIAKDISDIIGNVKRCIEIGPGFGALSYFLIPNSSLYLGIEKDRKLFDYLSKNFRSFNSWFFNASILDFPLEIYNGYSDIVIVGNIPYNITSPILRMIGGLKGIRAVLMVQKEVFDRIIASVGDKNNYSRLTVFMNVFFDIKELFYVPSKYFYPTPRVDSVVFEVVRKGIDIDINRFELLLKAAFHAKRKKIINNLVSSPYLKIKKDSVESVLSEIGIEKDLRAEDIHWSLYIEMYKALVERQLL